jgi:flagellar assembly protein FliH
MCAKARSEGMKSGQVRAAENRRGRALVRRVRAALAEPRRDRNEVRQEAAQLALAAARKLAPIGDRRLPAGDVEAALREAMHQAIGEPRIVLRASPASSRR